jgi:hypothetical protein
MNRWTEEQIIAGVKLEGRRFMFYPSQQQVIFQSYPGGAVT